MEYLFQIGHVPAEVAAHIAHILRIAATLHDQPARPLHLVQRLLHLPQVDARVLVQCHAVSQRGMNLGDMLLAQCLQFLTDIALLIDGILQIIVNLDALAVHLL